MLFLHPHISEAGGGVPLDHPSPHHNSIFLSPALVNDYYFKKDQKLWLPGGSAGKETSCSAGDLGLIPGLGRPPGEGNGYLLQYSGLENSMDGIHGVAKSQTQLNNFPSLSTSLQSVIPVKYLLSFILCQSLSMILDLTVQC